MKLRLSGLLTEEVVDAKYLALGEGLVDAGIEGDRAVQVAPEGLLHDHAGALYEVGVAEHVDDRDRRLGWDAQVVKPAHPLTEVFLRLCHRFGERLGSGALGNVVQLPGESAPILISQGVRTELIHGVASESPK
jgi:hypothetical protein